MFFYILVFHLVVNFIREYNNIINSFENILKLAANNNSSDLIWMLSQLLFFYKLYSWLLKICKNLIRIYSGQLHVWISICTVGSVPSVHPPNCEGAHMGLSQLCTMQFRSQQILTYHICTCTVRTPSPAHDEI